jgi:DNA-binding NarL/FixJ family response regulator
MTDSLPSTPVDHRAAAARVLIIDDHPIVRFGLTHALARSGDFTVCGEADDVASARAKAISLAPDFIVLDLGLGGRDGVELLAELVALVPGVKVLAFSALPELTYARRVFHAGGHGYLMKDGGVEQVPSALAAIARGERFASAEVQTAVFQEFAGGGSSARAHDDAVSTLTPRELQVLRLLSSGRSISAIANELNLSVKTVGSHRERLKDKLGVDSARELERVADELIRTRRL